MNATQSTFLGLEITKTCKGFEIKNSTDLVEFLLNLYGLENSKSTANPGGRSTVMELASATLLDGHAYSKFRTAVGNLIFMALWRPDMQIVIRQLSTQVLNPTTESKRAVKQLIRYLKGTQHTCLRLEPRGMVQKGLLELVGRSDSDLAGDSAKRQSVTGYHCNSARCDDVQPKSDADSNQSHFMRSGVLRKCLRRRTSGTRRTLQGTALQRFSSSRDGFRFGTTHSTAQTTKRTQAYRNTMLGNTTVDTRKTSVGGASGHKEQHCRSRHETSGWTEKAVARKETWTLNPGLDSLCSHIWIKTGLESIVCSETSAVMLSFCLHTWWRSLFVETADLRRSSVATRASIMTEPLDAELLKDLRGLGKPPSFDGNDT